MNPSSASVLVGMHGAALFHMLGMNVDHPKCCAVVEMYHKRWSQFATHGHPPSVGNMARFLGIRHSYVLSDEKDDVSTIRSRGQGTVVAIAALKTAVEAAVAAMA